MISRLPVQLPVQTKVFLVLGFTTLGILSSAWAQRRPNTPRDRTPRQELVYDNVRYLPEIRSVLFHPRDQEGALPVLFLRSEEGLVLSFDDLRGDIRNFYFSIEHCTAHWESSHLSPLEFAEGYNEDRISDINPSVNTLQAYTHYRLELPSRNVRPKLSGNYLLKVYEDTDKRRLILTQRFYVVAPTMEIAARVMSPVSTTKRATHQQININIVTGGRPVSNPYMDLQLLVLQNQRPDVQAWASKPSYVGPQEIRYENLREFEFESGNEFRYVDLRSVRIASEHVASIRTDTAFQVEIHPQTDRSGQPYASLPDENGRFYIRNLDRTDADRESEYLQVTFSLMNRDLRGTGSTPLSEHKKIFLVGGFNRFQTEPNDQLQLDTAAQHWKTTVLLKQGVYDYDFVIIDRASGEQQSSPFSGSHFQTENDYQILLYHRRPGTTWDEISGFTTISSRY